MDCFALSHSRAEGGQNAGQETWNASKEQARETPLLDTEEKLEAMRDFARDSGGWTREEIAAWDAEEINALFLQWIAGDVRQMPAIISEDHPTHAAPPRADSIDEIDWDEYEADENTAGRLFRSDDGKIYFHLGA